MGIKITCDVEGCEETAVESFEECEGNSVVGVKYACLPHSKDEKRWEGWEPRDGLGYHPRHYEEPWPAQPIGPDARGVMRFRENKIVTFLLNTGPNDMNSIAVADFSPEDREHFAQLIGYSLSGFGELSYTSDQTYEAAAKMADAQKPAPGQNGTS